MHHDIYYSDLDLLTIDNPSPPFFVAEQHYLKYLKYFFPRSYLVPMHNQSYFVGKSTLRTTL